MPDATPVTSRFGQTLLALTLAWVAWGWAPQAVAIKTSQPELWLRSQNGMNRLQMSPKGHYLAFTDGKDMGLFVLELKSRKIFSVTPYQVGAAFFWSPHGHRLLYREHTITPAGDVESRLNAYDAKLKQSVKLESYPFKTGYPTFDPRDFRMHMMKPTGITTKKLEFPGVRLAKWQIYQRTQNGKWLATPKAVLWVTQGGLTIRELTGDRSGIESFAISPDGSVMAWATNNGRIFLSDKGGKPQFYAYGRDPSWHPSKALILFAGGRMVGNKAASYDIRIGDLKGVSRFVTSTQFSSERWPRFDPEGRTVFFTKARTTDIYRMELQH